MARRVLRCAPAAAALLGRYRIKDIALSLSHDRVSASAVAVAEDDIIDVPSSGRFLYRFLPFRRDVILDNLRRVYGGRVAEDEIVRLAQAHYGHLWRLFREFLRFRWLSHQRKMALVRIENVEAFAAALAQEKGVLLLTGHFGNWEVSTIAGLNHYPQMRGRFHFVRRAIKPAWLDRLVTRRFNAAGFGVFPKRGSLDAMLDALAAGDAIVFPFDQHARPPDGIEVEFFGAPAWTFKSLAIIALATGAPVLPACSWREAGWAPRVALRGAHDAHRMRKYQRGHPPQHACLQCGPGANHPAPAGAVVLGAPALEDRCAQGAAGQGQVMTDRALARANTVHRRPLVIGAMP